MAKKSDKKIDWKHGESYNQARSRWWKSLTPDEKREVFRRASERGKEFQRKIDASRRKSAA